MSPRSNASLTYVISGPFNQVTKPKMKNSAPTTMIGPRLLRGECAGVVMDGPAINSLVHKYIFIETPATQVSVRCSTLSYPACKRCRLHADCRVRSAKTFSQ